jgi:hypothetical protein
VAVLATKRLYAKRDFEGNEMVLSAISRHPIYNQITVFRVWFVKNSFRRAASTSATTTIAAIPAITTAAGL